MATTDLTLLTQGGAPLVTPTFGPVDAIEGGGNASVAPTTLGGLRRDPVTPDTVVSLGDLNRRLVQLASRDEKLKDDLEALAGEIGGSLRTGTGAPATGLGAVGDLYFRTDNQSIYGPKTTEGGWGNGISLVGPAGPDGASGNVVTAFDADVGLAGVITGRYLDVYLLDREKTYPAAGNPLQLLFPNNVDSNAIGQNLRTVTTALSISLGYGTISNTEQLVHVWAVDQPALGALPAQVVLGLSPSSRLKTRFGDFVTSGLSVIPDTLNDNKDGWDNPNYLYIAQPSGVLPRAQITLTGTARAGDRLTLTLQADETREASFICTGDPQETLTTIAVGLVTAIMNDVGMQNWNVNASNVGAVITLDMGSSFWLRYPYLLTIAKDPASPLNATHLYPATGNWSGYFVIPLPPMAVRHLGVIRVDFNPTTHIWGPITSVVLGGVSEENETLDAHLASIAGGAHPAGAISFQPGTGIDATDVQAAIGELNTDIMSHLADGTDAHNATSVKYVAPDGGIIPFIRQDVQAAIDTLSSEFIFLREVNGANNIGFSPTADISANKVQAAIEEVRAEAIALAAADATTKANAAEAAAIAAAAASSRPPKAWAVLDANGVLLRSLGIQTSKVSHTAVGKYLVRVIDAPASDIPLVCIATTQAQDGAGDVMVAQASAENDTAYPGTVCVRIEIRRIFSGSSPTMITYYDAAFSLAIFW